MTFFEVLTAAIRDLSEFGFDSIERVDLWTTRLREAAKRSMASPAAVENMLNDGLATIYRRLIENGGILRYHPHVSRFTLAQVKPHLRAELDRRIMASAQLIRLNRTEAVEKTMQRFQGWATSIPIGGSSAVEKQETKTGIRKALAQLPFEERRVLIDQGHKLTASLSSVLATSGGAIACEWRSNWRQAGYHFRPDHKERDREIYLLKDSWARDRGLIKVGDAGYYDDITKAAEEVFCRCTVRWIYAIRNLPADMVTEAGRDELARVRRQIATGPLAAPSAL
jgi:hypothetical protein